MRTTLSLASLVLVLFSIPAPAATPAHLWSQRFGGTLNDVANSVALDPSGNILTTGAFRDVINFGTGPLTSTGNTDIYIAKFNAAGTNQWSKSFGNLPSNNDFGYSITSDVLGNVYVAGYFAGTVDFGGGPLTSTANQDGFLVKYDPNGNHLWSERFGAASGNVPLSVITDGAGGVLLAGYFSGSTDFGGGPLTSAGNNDIFIAKFSAANGGHQWSKRFGATGPDQGNSVKVDGGGNVYLTGIFQASVDFGGGALTSAGGFDIYLAKFNPGGTYQWSQRFGSTGDDLAYRLAVDATGTTCMAGSFNGTVNFGGAPLSSAGLTDMVLAKYDSNGAHQWSKRFGGTTADLATWVALDGAGNVYMSGAFSGSVDLGGGAATSAGSDDGFLAKFTSNGTYLWDRRMGGPGSDFCSAIAADPAGNVVTTGYFLGGADFGGGTLNSSGGSVDIFLAAYSSGGAGITSIADIGNDQGRRVKIRFSRAAQDQVGFSTPVVKYEAYRRDDSPPALVSRNTTLLSQRQLLDTGWTFAGEVPAHQKGTYGIDVSTIADSTIVLGQYYSVFFIRASAASPGVFYDSPIDSGYSVDNLAPGIPENFAYSAGQLSWNKSKAPDFDYFSIYGSNTNAFGSATLLDHAVTSALDVVAQPYVYYFVTATDFSGNEGKPAVVNRLSGVGGTPKQYSLSLAAYPNPFNPETTVHFTVPAKGRVTIVVFDSQGARVATLVDAEKQPGAYTVAWRGRDHRGRTVGSGVYFARLTSPSGSRSYKMTLLK